MARLVALTRYVQVPSPCVSLTPILGSSRKWAGPRRRQDQRTRAERHRSTDTAWQSQMHLLTDAYLQWKHGKNVDVDPPVGPVYRFKVTAIHTHGEVLFSTRFCCSLISSCCRLVPQPSDVEANVALIRCGLLGCTPVQPTVAIALDCLELYHQLRRRQSSFSVQAMVKVLCAMNDVTYAQHLHDLFSAAFDVYLGIKSQVRHTLNVALGRAGPGWRAQFACPPCGFKQDNEPMLSPARLHAMDGNNSVKRVEGSGHADPRVFDSDYHILPVEVDRFKDDVGSCADRGPAVPPPRVDHDDAANAAECTRRWKAVNDATGEGSVRAFDQTGIFICACRHGIVEFFTEMAKYPLAVTNRLIDTYGDDQAMGHDIACSFKTTVARSSIGDKATRHRLQLTVNAFHGHAHNHLYQLRNHPLYQKKYGLEDLETCERIFSASNAVTRTIRFASHFHWLQLIDLHFNQWNRNRYLELGRFSYNNYRQALAIIEEYTPLVDAFKNERHLEDSDFERWIEEEHEYLQSLSKEPDEDVLKVAYVESILDLNSTHRPPTILTQTSADFGNADHTRANQAMARATLAERQSLLRKLKVAMEAVDDIKRRMGLTERMAEDSPVYREAYSYYMNRRFIRAVEALERLVIQRLFELSKANLSGTGYKLRRQISNAIARRSEAVRTALRKYNELAPLQTPPRPTLDYSEVASYGWLSDFELLKHSQHGILDKPWSSPICRELMNKYFKLCCAHVEIERLNVEVPRLQAWVDSDAPHILATAEKLMDSQPLLSAELRELYSECCRVNNVIRVQLQKLYVLPGYTGPRLMTVTISSDGDGQKQGAMLPDEDDQLNEEALSLEETVSRMAR
ncbi:hypothetical protein C8Q80DRAFT_1098477 [Daedaleopsis nitida]|nr:hypothetical protein C8Q80DRAFT_1098477 [Daedaleopsis nitida]